MSFGAPNEFSPLSFLTIQHPLLMEGQFIFGEEQTGQIPGPSSETITASGTGYFGHVTLKP